MRRTLVVPDVLLLGTLLAGLLLLSGCEGDYRPRAVGPIGEITVVMDSSHWTGPSGEALRANVTPWVETLPVSERSFQLRHLELTDERTYERVQDLKNVIIAAPLSDSTNETSFLRRRLSDEAEQAILDGQTAVVPKPNLWRRSQRIYYVAAASPDALAETFQSQGTQIRDTFTEATLQRMDRNMYEDDRRSALEDTLMQRHGFAVNMQSDFQIAVDTTTGSEGFVWLRRLLAATRILRLLRRGRQSRPDHPRVDLQHPRLAHASPPTGQRPGVRKDRLPAPPQDRTALVPGPVRVRLAGPLVHGRPARWGQ